jgi:hypothetical protein
MPQLHEAIQADLSGYSPVTEVNSRTASPPTNELQPGLNAMIRCPLPPIFQASPDSLRQFYVGGQVPQARLLSPASSAVTAPTYGTTSNTTAVFLNPTGSGSSTTSTVTAQQAVIRTPVLNHNGVFTGVISISKGFQLLNLSVGSPCRIQLYGTSTSQSLDRSRAIDTPPPAGTAQNIICDVVLDTTPYQWTFQNRVGANGDSPQKPSVYVTLTNLDVTSDVITLTLSYVPLES